MEPREKSELLGWLERGRDTFVAAVAGVTEADTVRSPGPGRWSVLECAEHVAVVEQYLYQRLLEAHPNEAIAIPSAREGLIRERAADRSRAVSAPEAAVPNGRYATLADALAAFVTARERTIAFLVECSEDLRAKVTSHPILKTATTFETLLMMAAHPERHAKQIAEIRGGLRGSSPQC